MKKVVVLIAALFFGGSLFSQGIEFEQGTWSEAFAKAKKENKMVFVDCYASWCGPCKYLAKTIFTQNKLGAFFNKSFVNVKMDVESEAGKPLMGKYGIKAYPTLLWLDSEGNVQHKMLGAADADSLIEEAKMAANPEKNWACFNKKFVGGERSDEFLQNYILLSSKLGCDTKEAVDAYFSTKKPEELINRKDAEIIMAAVKSTSDSGFVWLVKNKEKFYAVAEKKKIDQYIERTMMVDLWQVVRKGNREAIAAKNKELVALDKKIWDKLMALREVDVLQKGTDHQKYYLALVNYAMKYEFDNSDHLNSYAWGIAKAKAKLSKDVMVKALQIAKRSVELDMNFANTDTYAYLLHKLGMLEEARIQAEKSVNLAPEKQKTTLWANQFLNEKQE